MAKNINQSTINHQPSSSDVGSWIFFVERAAAAVTVFRNSKVEEAV